jgi:glyoxalase family protein
VTSIKGVHHFAYSTSEAEREIRFHEDVLGLRLVSREPQTLRGRAGEKLVFGLADSPADGFLVAFCLGADGPSGRQGSNGPNSPNLSVPAGSLDYWQARLHDAHVEGKVDEVFGTKRLVFTAPSRIRYTLIESGQPASGPTEGDATFPVLGLHSVTVSLMDVRETHSFLLDLFGGQHTEQDLSSGYYQFSDGAEGAGIELLHEPYRAPGTWTYAVGTPHHVGLDVADAASREQICERLRDAGYHDVSPVVEDTDSDSVWVRAPGGALVALVCRTHSER